jgi:hypothetical protein
MVRPTLFRHRQTYNYRGNGKFEDVGQIGGDLFSRHDEIARRFGSRFYKRHRSVSEGYLASPVSGSGERPHWRDRDQLDRFLKPSVSSWECLCSKACKTQKNLHASDSHNLIRTTQPPNFSARNPVTLQPAWTWTGLVIAARDSHARERVISGLG